MKKKNHHDFIMSYHNGVLGDIDLKQRSGEGLRGAPEFKRFYRL